MKAGDLVDACEPAIWQAFSELPDERSADQLCKLGMMYASAGRVRFRERLFEVVAEKDVEDDLTLGEDELIRVAGLDGLAATVRKRGERLLGSTWDWDDGTIAEKAVKQYGEDVVRAFLRSHEDEHIRVFLNEWHNQSVSQVEESPRISHRERMSSISIDEVFEAAATNDRCYWFRGWGMHADQNDVDEVLKRIECTNDTEVLQRLLKVFMRRELPWISTKLFQLCRSEDDQVAFFASRALEGNQHPEIRDFALKSLERGETGRGIDLLASNFVKGDEYMVQDCVEITDDADERHSLLMSCRSLLEENPSANASPLAEVIYEHTPCSLCRTSGVKLLIRQNMASEWTIHEVRFDCDEGTRQLFYPQPSQWIG